MDDPQKGPIRLSAAGNICGSENPEGTFVKEQQAEQSEHNTRVTSSRFDMPSHHARPVSQPVPDMEK